MATDELGITESRFNPIMIHSVVLSQLKCSIREYRWEYSHCRGSASRPAPARCRAPLDGQPRAAVPTPAHDDYLFKCALDVGAAVLDLPAMVRLLLCSVELITSNVFT